MRFSKALPAGRQIALQKGSANYRPAAVNECFVPPHTLLAWRIVVLLIGDTSWVKKKKTKTKNKTTQLIALIYSLIYNFKCLF